jgi:hypothetical protein
MTSYLHELYPHQEWADAEHWRGFEAHPEALADKAIRERLLHIHLVQSAFLWWWARARHNSFSSKSRTSRIWRT